MSQAPGRDIDLNCDSLYTPADDSLNAVMMIALLNFKVKHIVVAVSLCTREASSHPQGHSNCVGCQTALRASMLPPVPATQAIQRYLKPLTALARAMHNVRRAAVPRPPRRGMTLFVLLSADAKENVGQQVRNLLACQLVAVDWQRRGENGVTVHGWVYQLENGTIRDLGVSQGPPNAKVGRKAGFPPIF